VIPPSCQHSAFRYVSLSPFGGMTQYSDLARFVAAFAQLRGYRLRGVFVDERGRSDVTSFHALLREVRLGKATVVLVPDFGHLAHLPCLVGADERTMTRYIRARVVSIADAVERESLMLGEVASEVREFASVGR
jgi:hypothetical protein